MTDTGVLARLREGCEWQLDLCRRNGSPTYAGFITGLLGRLGVDDKVTDLLAADGQDPIRSALCLRLFGAVNRLAAARPRAKLFSYYPARGGEAAPEEAAREFFDILGTDTAAVAAELPRPVQTNEVGRAAPLSAAMHHVAAVTGLPLRLLEVGASAGLNLWLDRYHVDAGPTRWGPPDSPVQLIGHFEAGPGRPEPPAHRLVVAGRRGCDLSPLDVHEPGTPGLLRSFVWPEHVDRMQRLDTALEVAQAAPPVAIDAAAALPWTATHAAYRPSGQTTVIYHSIVLPYLEPGERARFTGLVESLGAAADESAPLAWVCLEPTEEEPHTALLTCAVWPANRRVVLARATPHGLRVRWEPTEAPA